MIRSPNKRHRRPLIARAAGLFKPIVVGGTLKSRLIACIGAMLAIGLTATLCRFAFADASDLPFIVAPIGASALLLFAVPASPLAQPWSIVGGNTLSALVGITVHKFTTDPALAAALAVALAIAAMSLMRCLHPPGGAAALTAVMGGPAVASAGYAFAFVPVAINSMLLVLFGWAFHKLLRQTYPHIATSAPTNVHDTRDLPAPMRVGFQDADIDAALADIGETYDIGRDDIDRLLRQVEMRALIREHRDLTCADLMSKDIVFIYQSENVETARRLLVEHAVRTLPVVDRGLLLLGTVGLRDLLGATGLVGDVMVPATTALPQSSAMAQFRPLTDGATHAVFIVDEKFHTVGVISQTDMLAAMARVILAAQSKSGTNPPPLSNP